VTFVLQKNKDELPGFEEWYPLAQKEWAENRVLTWAKDSRNTIEKMGDLAMYSAITVAFVTSYFEEEDQSIEIDKNEYLPLALAKIRRLSQSPTNILDAEEWVIKVERRWIANSLPGEELLWALNYVYAKQYQLCSSIAQRYRLEMDRSIPKPTDQHLSSVSSRHIMYLDAFHEGFGELSHFRITKDPSFPANALLPQQQERWRAADSFESFFEAIALNAKELFDHDGYLIPMVFAFNPKNELIDFLPLHFDKRYKKFVVWRDLAQRLSYLDVEYVVTVSEAWVKNMPAGEIGSVSKLPNVGEVLDVSGVDKRGKFLSQVWKIVRSDGRARTADQPEVLTETTIPSYLALVLRAISDTSYQKRGSS
jgi:hypothetical protein